MHLNSWLYRPREMGIKIGYYTLGLVGIATLSARGQSQVYQQCEFEPHDFRPLIAQVFS